MYTIIIEGNDYEMIDSYATYEEAIKDAKLYHLYNCDDYERENSYKLIMPDGKRIDLDYDMISE